MNKPTGKLAHAYSTIAAQEERIEQLEAELARAQSPTAGGALPEAYKCTPKKGGTPFVIRRAPDTWELRECDIEVVPVHSDNGETDQSIASDCYWRIADVMGTEPCWSVQEHIEFMRETMEDAASYLGNLSGHDQSGKLPELNRRISLCLSGAAPGYTPRLFPAPLSAQDVSGLLEALRNVEHTGSSSRLRRVAREAREALAAHRATAQGGDA